MAKKSQQTLAIPASDEWISQYVAQHNRTFVASNPKGTLKDLRDRLRLAVEQCEWLAELSDDARIKEWTDIPEPLASELAEWDNSEDDCTFEYRWENLVENTSLVEELIDEVGPRFRLSRLPKCGRPTSGKAAPKT